MTPPESMVLYDMTLFDNIANPELSKEDLCPGAVVLRNFALQDETALLREVHDVIARSPFRHMVTRGGFRMSAAMTNCGNFGWVTDRKGYRYQAVDPETGDPWPPMSDAFRHLAIAGAREAGFPNFIPDSCLINRYEPGAKMSLHQDINEQDFTHPIVSVSLGIPAVFLFGGAQRSGKTTRVPLFHGDIVVWGGPARLNYHGILPLKEASHPLVGAYRLNLTFRKARP